MPYRDYGKESKMASRDAEPNTVCGGKNLLRMFWKKKKDEINLSVIKQPLQQLKSL